MGFCAEDFRRLRAQHFEPLVRALGLKPGRSEEEELFGVAEALGANACVRFEHERGLCHFSVFAASQPQKRWSAVEVAVLFPRVRAMPGAEQRLTLEEQAELIQSRWSELDVLLSTHQYSQTAVALNEKSADLIAGYVGDTRALEQMQGLFRSGRYKEVLSVFQKLKFPQRLTKMQQRMVEVARERAR